MGEGEQETKSRAGCDKWVLKDLWPTNVEHTHRVLFMSEDQEADACQALKAGFCSGGEEEASAEWQWGNHAMVI